MKKERRPRLGEIWKSETCGCARIIRIQKHSYGGLKITYKKALTGNILKSTLSTFVGVYDYKPLDQ